MVALTRPEWWGWRGGDKIRGVCMPEVKLIRLG